MNGTVCSHTPATVIAELDASFVEGVSWPIDRAALAALLDMGLSPRQIARYFAVSPTEVLERLHAVGMSER